MLNIELANRFWWRPNRSRESEWHGTGRPAWSWC